MFKSRKEKVTLSTAIGFGLTDGMGGSSGAIIDFVTGVIMGNITDSFYRTKLVLLKGQLLKQWQYKM